MYYVYFARGFDNEKKIAECKTFVDACIRAEEQYTVDCRDVKVYDSNDDVVYDLAENFLIDEL